MTFTTLGRNKAGGDTLNSIDVESLILKLREGSGGQYVSHLREELPFVGNHEEESRYYDRIPRICTASRYSRSADGGRCWASYNGVVTLLVGENASDAELEHLREQAQQVPQTLMAFRALNNHQMIILVRVSLPDGSLPADEHQASLFHMQAYKVAVTSYATVLSQPIQFRDPVLDETVKMSIDGNAYYNDHAAPFLVNQPTKVELMRQDREEADVRMHPMAGDVIGYIRLYGACYRRALNACPQWVTGGDSERIIIAIARECLKAGMPSEECVKRTYWRFDHLAVDEVRTIVNGEYESYTPRRVFTLPKKQEAALRLREFFCRRYDIRYNEVLRQTEFRERYSMQLFYRTLSPRDLNTIKHEAALEGIQAFDSEVKGLLESNFVPAYNPVEDYLRSLPAWDGEDYIGQLAAMVPTQMAEWSRLFYRWFLSMVAHWMDIDPEHSNATAPILIGDQGFRKSTFCRLLLPPELRQYFTDSIDFRNDVEAERYLGRFLLVNIDEFDQLSDSQFAFVKHLFQKPVANIRRSYSQAIEAQRRYASFIGTSNQSEILRDPTGNRRYICVEVTSPIRVDTPVNYEQLYAQAMHLINKRERTWLNDEDEAIINANNSRYEVQTPLEQLFLRYFSVAEEDDEAGRWVYMLDVLNVLRQQPEFTQQMNSPHKLGRILTRYKALKEHRKDGNVYFLKRIY